MKIISIVGARPQFIKAAVISREIKEYNKTNFNKIEEIIVHTGQHFDDNMSQIFFDEMNIPEPSYNLDVSSLSHGAMLGRMTERIEDVLLEEKPDCIIVYGDTNSTLAGAIAAKKLKIKIAHIEAGLRSFNIIMPEEQNRLLSDRISDFLFCPTEKAMYNLIKEGIADSLYGQKAYFTGDVMYDAVLHYKSIADKTSDILEVCNLTENNFILTTIHRAETTDNISTLKEILETLNEISNDIEVVIPIHPRTKNIMLQNNLDQGKLTLIEPVSYFDMLKLEQNAKLIMTDSGGVQKEAFFMRKPCITLRNETEWVELIENKVNYLAGVKKDKILEYYDKIKLLNQADFEKGFYGDGRAGEKILKILLDYF